MLKHGVKMSNRFLDITSYIPLNNPTKEKFRDTVVCYYNGIRWNIIPIRAFYSYPVIYDKYYDKSNDKFFNISICVCPFTLSASIFKGKFYPSEYVLYSSLVLTNKNNLLLPIISNYATLSNGRMKKIKRWVCYIKLLKNAIVEHRDCQFIQIDDLPIPINNNKYYENEEIKFPTELYSDDIHPKTLIYVLQYKSSQSLNDKYTIIIGKNKDKNSVSGFDTSKSYINKYLENMKNKIKEKNAFILPMMWFSWFSLFPNAKIIDLSS